MPTTRRRDSAIAGSEQQSGEPPSQLLLHFNEPLSWKAGKAIPVADLLSRLQKLANETTNLTPQGEVDPKSVFKIAQELVNPNLLAHKDRGVRAWTTYCVVDLLRICVPHAPFRNAQLKVCPQDYWWRWWKDVQLRRLGHLHHHCELHHTTTR